MGVGLEAGLTIDAMADELAELLDRADEAALKNCNYPPPCLGVGL